MPSESTIVDNGRGFERRVVGAYSAQDLIDGQAWTHAAVAAGHRFEYALVDLTEVTAVTFSAGHLHRLLDGNAKLVAQSLFAHVALVSGSEATYIAATQWQTYGHQLGLSAQIFAGRADAVAWLQAEGYAPPAV